MTKKQNPETKIMSSVIKTLGLLRGAMIWRNNVGRMRAPSGAYVQFGEPGASDIFMVFRGQFYGIEVKAPNGRMSDAQFAWRRRLLDAGGDYLVVDSAEAALRFVKMLRSTKAG